MVQKDKLITLISKNAAGLSGNVSVPGDKSISHRSLMFGGIAEGETTIVGLLESEDVKATRAALAACGAVFYMDNKGNWRARGVGDKGLKNPSDPIDLGNSGTSTRLLIGLFSGFEVECEIIGDASLSKRPMARVTDPLETMGASFEHDGSATLPLKLTTTSQLQAITYTLPLASAQVKSALLLAGLNARGTTTIIENTPTRDHTETMLRQFGVNVEVDPKENSHHISIQGGQALKATKIQVPGDPSSAAFPTVAALITQGSEIKLENVLMTPTRNGLYTTLLEMGADIEIITGKNESADLIVKSSSLKGIEVPAKRIASMIDECPILFVAAACASGTTTLTGLEELRVKESDRLHVMAEGLKACGVELEEGESSLIIHGTGTAPVGGATIDPQLDHRIAMSFLILGMACERPITISDGSAIETSFPGFKDVMNTLGAHIS